MSATGTALHRSLSTVQGNKVEFGNKANINLSFDCQVHRAKSCPELKVQKKLKQDPGKIASSIEVKQTEEIGTQTYEVIPYEHLFVGILSQRSIEHPVRQNSESRLSPSSMLDRYVEACARLSSSSNGDH